MNIKLIIAMAVAVALVAVAFFVFKRKRRGKKMPVGMQVFNSAGQVVFDSSGVNRYGRIIGSFTVPASSAYHSPTSRTHNDSRITTSNTFYSVVGVNGFDTNYETYGIVVTVSNGSITAENFGMNQVRTIYYGVF